MCIFQDQHGTRQSDRYLVGRHVPGRLVQLINRVESQDDSASEDSPESPESVESPESPESTDDDSNSQDSASSPSDDGAERRR